MLNCSAGLGTNTSALEDLTIFAVDGLGKECPQWEGKSTFWVSRVYRVGPGSPRTQLMSRAQTLKSGWPLAPKTLLFGSVDIRGPLGKESALGLIGLRVVRF